MKQKGATTIKHTTMKTSTLDVRMTALDVGNYHAANQLRNAMNQFAL